MRTKICGITNIDDALFCADEGADALGFIFTERSPRYISYSSAELIIKKLPPFTIKIGVFVNASVQHINSISTEIGLSAVQLHGDETEKEIKEIKIPVIKAFRVNENFSYDDLDNFSGITCLLDTYSKESYGGTGKCFDWNSIPDRHKSRIILAGGISVLNIEHIYRNIKPYAIDLSSSLELSPGIKDHNKAKEFLNTINKLRGQ